jgi:RNA polymerase sigma-70 factor, ECF subfamily
LTKSRLLFIISHKMNEAELIKRCLKKDKKAWALFLDKYSNLVYWAIRRRLSASSFLYNENDIDDIFQEVFLSILSGRKLAQIKDVNRLSGWLAMLASNKAFDIMLQKVRSREVLNFQESFFPEVGGDNASLPADTAVLVKEAIDGLSDRERVVISLNLLEEKTHKEIAFILGIPVNTVSTVISRTKQKLAKILDKMGIGDYL